MEQSEWLADIGAVLADRSRSVFLTLLMDGRAYTATELARAAGVTPQTGTHHLQRLETANFVHRVRQGRHSYFRIASDEVATFIERMLAAQAIVYPDAIATSCPAGLRLARSCYGHLAGKLGVRLCEHALAKGWFVMDGETLRLRDDGATFASSIGLNARTLVPAAEEGRACLDWSERRFHVGGRLGAALLDAMLEQRWFLRGEKRELVLTESGKRQVAKWS